MSIQQETLIRKNLAPSRILEILGLDMFAEFNAFMIPGKVVWCNVELAREMGFDVPDSDQTTPQLQQQLINMLSYRALRPGEDASGRATIKLYADKYGGNGVAPNLGSARAGFAPYGNLHLKGIGLTPLFRRHNEFLHSHGGFHMDEGFAEIIFGEVNAHLFSQTSTRILAMIDQGDFTRLPNGRLVARAIVCRVGNQLRPGHFIARHLKKNGKCLDVFVKITKETGQLVTRTDERTGREVPDLRATMLRVINDHAQTAAEQVRWRISHNAISSSNMQMNGGLLDVTTEGAHPRIVSIGLPPRRTKPDTVYNRDYLDRAAQMRRLYRALISDLSRRQRRSLNAVMFNVDRVMSQAYLRQLEKYLLCAVGLKMQVAQRLQADHADLVQRFAHVLIEMAALKNPGSLRQSRSLIQSQAALNIFQLLKNFPPIYFQNPDADHRKSIRAELEPIYKGNKFHVASKRAAVSLLIKEFISAYRELMNSCRPLAREHYGSVAKMQKSIASRAAYENEPLTQLYRAQLYVAIRQTISEYKSMGDASVLRRLAHNRIAASFRNVDALLFKGGARLLADASIEMNRRIVRGIDYSTRAWNNQAQTRRIQVCIRVTREGDDYLTSLPSQARLSARQIQSLRYRFTTDGWASAVEVGARLARDEQNRFVIIFDGIRPRNPYGALEGAFYSSRNKDFCLKDEDDNFRGYSFALPDKLELLELLRIHSRAGRQPAQCR